MLRVEAGVGSRSRRWLAGVCCCVLLACGTTSAHPTPDANESSAGVAGRAGGGSAGNGGSAGRGLLLGGTAGSLVDNDGGELSLGGAADPGAYDGPVDLCLYDEDIPDNWGAAGSAESDGPDCAVGVLGRFAFDGCRYELLNTTPFNVDPFVGGHSHCCYRSKLVGCP